MPSRVFVLFSFLVGLVLIGCNGSEAPSGRSADIERALAATLEDYPEATIAVAVIDPATETRYALNGDTVFHAASMMKVPVMIEVFRQAEEGRFSMQDSIVVENAFHSIIDSSTYRIETDSDDSIYDELGGQMSILDLTRNMITVSSNLAANILIEHVGADAVQNTVERLGSSGVTVLRGVEDLRAYEEGQNNTATASGVAALFEALMHGQAVSPAADSQMIEILLDQQFNSMIPPGLPPETAFAHKTGWISSVHHDGGIVAPRDSRPYVLVVMTRGVGDEGESAALGAEIATAVHQVLRDEEPEADDPPSAEDDTSQTDPA